MYQRLVNELKLRFDQDVELNLSICHNPLTFYEDRVAQFKLGMDFLAKYSSAINEENALDVLAQIRSEIIEHADSKISPHAFISALEDVCEEKERRLTYEVYKVMEDTIIELEYLKETFHEKDMIRGCDYIRQMVEWIKSSNLHAELKNIEHSLDIFHRQTIKLIPNNDQSGFLYGATRAIGLLKEMWASFDPLIIKPSVRNKSVELCEWCRYADATMLVRSYAQRIDNYKSGYIMLSRPDIAELQLAREVRFFRAMKEHFIRLIDSDFEKIQDKIMESRDLALSTINRNPNATEKEKSDKMYYLTSIADTAITAAQSLKPKLEQEMFISSPMMPVRDSNWGMGLS